MPKDVAPAVQACRRRGPQPEGFIPDPWRDGGDSEAVASRLIQPRSTTSGTSGELADENESMALCQAIRAPRQHQLQHRQQHRA